MYFTREAAESKSSSAVFRALSNIGDISYRFTIEIRQIDEIEECASSTEVTDIIDDIRESRVDIRLVEFSMKWEYLDSSIGTGFLDFKLGKHNEDL